MQESVYCCFCVTINKDQINCRACKAAVVEIIEVKLIVKWQKGFKLGCYCEKDRGTKS